MTRWQGLKLTGKRLENGDMEPGNPIIITCHGKEHEKDQGATLCPGCIDDFAGVLADIPTLFDDLDIALSGEAKFVEHGFRTGESLSGVGANRNPAIAAQQRLTLALLGDGTNAHPGCSDWFDARNPTQIARHLALYLHQLIGEPRMPTLAHDISSAAARAHHVIDTPKDLVFYGPCPDCGRDITQERIRRDDTTTPVRCRFPSCGYNQPLDVHQKRILEANLDRQMTVNECVSAITSAGEVVTRDQINGWIRHKGLPREWTERPEWQGGSPVMVGMWTLTLRDVLDFARRAEEKKQAKTVS